MRVLIDSNCIVAAALPIHEHHAATLNDLSRRLDAGEVFVVAAHSLVEAYAVLTRLPAPYRLSAADAQTVLDRNWSRVESVALTGSETWRVLKSAAQSGVTGGRAYDSVIAACARKGKADELLTWNLRHFVMSPGTHAITPRG